MKNYRISFYEYKRKEAKLFFDVASKVFNKTADDVMLKGYVPMEDAEVWNYIENAVKAYMECRENKGE